MTSLWMLKLSTTKKWERLYVSMGAAGSGGIEGDSGRRGLLYGVPGTLCSVALSMDPEAGGVAVCAPCSELVG